jgi:peptidyl-prolyl cis-trans isomerase D
MGAIGSIRKHSWVAVLVVGIAIVAFIIGDLTKNQNSGQFVIAKVGKATFLQPTFEEMVKARETMYMNNAGVASIPSDVQTQIREQVWQELVEDTLLGMEYAKLGIRVTEDEQEAMMYEDGSYTHPYMRQWFTDPNTGVYNAQMASQYFRDETDRLDDAMKSQVAEMKEAVIKGRMQEKYNSLISKGFYMPKALAEREAKLNGVQSDVLVAMASYQNVSEENSTPTDEDYQKYMKEHKAEVEMMMGLKNYDEIRKIEYITYPVMPSQEDLSEIAADVEKTWAEFQTKAEVADVIDFVNSESREAYDSTYMKAAQLGELDSLVERTAVGGYIEPRQIGNEWVMAKVLESAMRPDSVKATVVLILNNTTGMQNITRTDEEAKAVADTVAALMRMKDANLEEIVNRYSDDPQKSQNKGDMGWALDQTIYGFLNEDIVKTPVDGVFNFKRPDDRGYVVVKVTGKTPLNKKYRVAKISKEIVPSNRTSTLVYNTANQFIGQNRSEAEVSAAAQAGNLTLREQPVYEMMNQLPGIENAREIVRWAFDKKRKIGDVSEEVYDCGDMYVVVTLKDIYKSGKLTVDQVKNEIEPYVRLEKKAEYLMGEATEAVASTKDINTLAQKFNTTVDSAQTKLGDYYFGRYGMEPKVMAKIACGKQGSLVGPIRGASGVYFVNIYNRTEQPVDVETARAMLSRSYMQKVNMASQVLRRNTKIVDNRSRFF